MANELKLNNPIVVGNAASDPATGFNGEIYYNTSTNKFRIFQSGAWADMSSGGSGITSLTGDVSATGPGAAAATVNSVGGSSAFNVHLAELAANAATDMDMVSTIVKRDGSGNFSATTITANLTGNASGSAASFTGSLSGDVTGTQSATVVATVGGSSAANVHSAELAANAATNLNTPSTIVKRDSSGNFSAGTITATLSGNATNVSGTVAIGNGGTGQVTAPTAFNALSPVTSTGDLIVGNGTNSNTRLPKGSQYQTLQTGASTVGYDAVHLDQAAAVTGILPNANTTATNANTPSTIVERDSSGNFSAGTVTADLAGDPNSQLTVIAGTPTASNTAGQNLVMESGSPNGAADAGFIRLASANAVGSGSSGEFDGGGNDGSGGTITLQSGTGTVSFPGDIHLTAGDNSTGATDGGYIFLNAGNSSGGSGNGGNIQITPGTGAAPGSILLQGTINTPLTASRAVVTDGSSDLAASATTSTEIGFVSGVTSSIQTQLNGKQATGNYITALTGDIAASGPGSAAATLATVNSNVGSFTNASVTVNAKGLVTAASSGTTGNLTDVGTDGIAITGGTGAVLGTGTSIAQQASDATHNGYLSSTDWSTFNGKVSGPGSSTNQGIARFNGTGGATIENTSTTSIDNSGNIFIGTGKIFMETPGTASPAFGLYKNNSAGTVIDIFVNNTAFTPAVRIESGGILDINPSASGAALNLGGNNTAGTATVAAASSSSVDGTTLNINAGNTASAGNAGGPLTLHAGDNTASSGTSPGGKALVRGGNQNSGTGTNNGGDVEIRGGNSANAGNGGNVLLTPGTSSTGLPGVNIVAGRFSMTGIQRETSSTTVTIANNTSVFIADYGSLQSSATITLPASTALSNGQMLSFGAGTNGITSLTMTAGSGTTLTGPLTTLTTGTTATFIYVTATTTWYRVS